MAFVPTSHPTFHAFLQNLRYSNIEEHAPAENFILEERLSDAREVNYAVYTNFSTDFGLWNYSHENFLADRLYVKPGVPETFQAGNTSNFLPNLAEDQDLLRMENLAKLIQYAVEDTNFEPIKKAFEKKISGTLDLPAQNLAATFLFNLNHRRDHRPMFAGFWGEVKHLFGDDGDTDNLEWADKVRDCFGLGHFDPEGGTPIPVILFKYPLSEVMALAGGPGYAAIPTILDTNLNPFFFPTPAGWQNGQTVDLTTGGEDTYELYSEILNLHIPYRLEHVYRIGEIRRSPGKTCETARSIHLKLLARDLKYFHLL